MRIVVARRVAVLAAARREGLTMDAGEAESDAIGVDDADSAATDQSPPGIGFDSGNEDSSGSPPGRFGVEGIGFDRLTQMLATALFGSGLGGLGAAVVTALGSSVVSCAKTASR
jgi:hypothetical protein